MTRPRATPTSRIHVLLARTVALSTLLALPAAALTVLSPTAADAATVATSTATAAAPVSTAATTPSPLADGSAENPAGSAPAGSATTAAQTPNADGVQVGSGSYAPTPPSTITDSSDVQTTLNQHLYIDPSQAGKPVPTNQWWTDGVVNKFGGNMWTYPFVSSNSAAGNKLSIASDWNSDGTSMVTPDSVTVGGQVTPTPDPSDEVLGGFENGLPSGWTTTGTAFTTATGTGAGQSQVSGWLGKGYLTSWGAKNGDGAQGTATSPTFTVDKSTLAFLIAGGQDATNEAVQLVVNGQVVDSATGKNSEQFSWVNWDVSQYAGQQATVRVVDSKNAGWAHVMVDQVMLTNVPTGIAQRYSTAFSASENDALRWGDWNVTWRLRQAGSGGQYVDVTEMQGSPYQWYEYHDMTPELTVANGATFTDGDGSTVHFPYTGDDFEIHQGGHTYGVHAPDGTTFTQTGSTIDASAGTAYLVMSAVPKSGMTVDQLQAHAFAIPRNTKMDYSYDSAKGKVKEDWSIDTDLLQGTDHDTVQGWLQHQYDDSTNNLSFTGATYPTPRGTMKTSIGHDGWTMDYAFSGLTPTGAIPTADAGSSLPDGDAYSSDVMTSYIHAYAAANVSYKGDTYWTGKNLEQAAEYMTVAKQIGDTADEKTLQATLTAVLTDWYTYSDGESQDFFAMYPTWKALIGFADSYGSAQFNDNHFHYGYFAVASALLGAVDPTWAKNYGGMATLVAQEYGNWDRSSTQFPYLRTFGVWEGHSNAGGVSSPNGNNQESSSEAIQSEAGLFLLGTVLGNKQMQATGAMEYVNERAAVRDYYQNVHGNSASSSYDGNGAFSSAYQYGQAGILFDSGQAEATYFDGDPAWIYGIQWMPTAPWFDYFGWDPDFSKAIMEQMMRARPKSIGQHGVVSGNAADIQMLTKKWYGVGTYGSTAITQDQNGAIGELEDAIRAAELNHPGYVTQKTAANPLYDASTGTLFVSTDAKDNVAFDPKYWTPATLPASLVPAQLTSAQADEQPQDWPVQSPLLPFLSTDYAAETSTINNLYSADLTHYTPGTDTAHAAAVFSGMGDALGEVVLGYLAQYDPATYADIHEALWKAKDPAVTGQDMSGMVYYQAMSNMTVGTEVTTRHTSDPLSQVFKAADGTYSYVLDNVDDVQHSYDVYDGSNVIGSIAVPANTQITSHLDAHLAKIVVSAKGSPKTIVPGSSTAFTATGYDQYGATVPLDGLSWSSSTGSIGSDGTFVAGSDAAKASVTAALGSVNDAYSFRVGPAPALTTIAVTPGFDQLIVGKAQQFTAAGRDQYGNPFDLPGSVAWAYTGPGTTDADGNVTTTGPGAGYITATAAGVEGSAVTSSVASLPDAALGKTATATFANTGVTTPSQSGNVPALALDNNLGTRWESINGTDTSSTPQDRGDIDFTVDLGKETDINDVAVNWEGAYAVAYSLDVSDSPNSGFHTLQTITGKPNANADDLPVDTTARYLRLHMTKRWNNLYGFSIRDLHVYGTPAASAMTPTSVLVGPRASTVLDGGSAQLTAYAFDAAGDGGPVTATSGAGAPVWTADGGGSVAADGTVTAASTGGVTTTVTATVGGAFGQATVTSQDNADVTDPGAGNDRDVAIGKPVTTSSDERADLGGDQAEDGDGTTRWSSAAQDGEWIAVDLGAVLPIDSVELDWESAYADTYQVQVRNTQDEPWQTVVTDDHGAGGDETHDLSGVSARYVRMLGGQRHTQYGYSLYEFRVNSKQGAPTPDLAKGAATSSSADESTSTPARSATDGDAGSRWASGHTDDQWLDVDLGSPQALHQAMLVWEGAYGKSYTIEARNSTDDDWTTLATKTNGQGGTDTLDLSGTWRYVRFQGVKRATPYGYSLYSFEIR